MKISIAIPTYECYGNGWLYISELLNSIYKQKYSNYEVVIADQSVDDKVKKISEVYSNFIDIKYYDSSTIPRKIANNFNFAISKCSGDIIKPMCSDDIFINDNALEIISYSFETSPNEWLVSACYHCESIHRLHSLMTPFYHDNIHLGQNTISSPSVLATRRKEYFDENLSLLVDCDMYKKLYVNYGNPIIIAEPLISNRMHSNQMQKNIDLEIKQKEIEYCIKKYN